MDLQLNRRQFLQTNAGLVVGVASGAVFVDSSPAQAATPSPVGPNPTELDTWVRIGIDGRVTVNFGKMDCGQGVDVAVAQFVADELDVPFSDVRVVLGDTRFTPNQGGASGSSAVRIGSLPLRNAAAEARSILLQMGSRRLGAPVCSTVDFGTGWTQLWH